MRCSSTCSPDRSASCAWCWSCAAQRPTLEVLRGTHTAHCHVAAAARMVCPKGAPRQMSAQDKHHGALGEGEGSKKLTSWCLLSVSSARQTMPQLLPTQGTLGAYTAFKHTSKASVSSLTRIWRSFDSASCISAALVQWPPIAVSVSRNTCAADGMHWATGPCQTARACGPAFGSAGGTDCSSWLSCSTRSCSWLRSLRRSLRSRVSQE